MTNPVGTKEQRDKLRMYSIGMYEQGAVNRSALDGLDIAEEMAKAIQCDGKRLTILSNLPDVLAEWDKWKGS